MSLEYELRRLDYERTITQLDQLSDIRFKLLALVPLVTGTALSFSEPGREPMTGAALGLLGFLVTIGIIIYDERNTEIYERQIRRAKLLELRLGLPPVSSKDVCGGPFMGRPGRRRKLFGRLTMWHDRGLALVYSATLGAWAYLFVVSIIGPLGLAKGIPVIFSTVIGLMVLIVFWRQFHQLDSKRNPDLAALDSEINEIVQQKLAERSLPS